MLLIKIIINMNNNEFLEVIGHIETPDGNIAEQIIAPAVGRGQYRRKKITKFICDFCGQSFKDRTRWIRHRYNNLNLS